MYERPWVVTCSPRSRFGLADLVPIAHFFVEVLHQLVAHERACERQVRGQLRRGGWSAAPRRCWTEAKPMEKRCTQPSTRPVDQPP